MYLRATLIQLELFPVFAACFYLSAALLWRLRHRGVWTAIAVGVGLPLLLEVLALALVPHAVAGRGPVAQAVRLSISCGCIVPMGMAVMYHRSQRRNPEPPGTKPGAGAA